MEKDNNNNNDKAKITLLDPIVLPIVIVLVSAAVIATIVTINNKYKKLDEEQLKKYKEVPSTRNIKYKVENNEISFYKSKKDIKKYKCINNCSVENNKNEFLIEKENTLMIKDNNKYMLLNIETLNIEQEFTNYPKISENKNYGTIEYNNKTGIINKAGKMILAPIFDKIIFNDDDILALNNNNLSMYDSNGKLKSTNSYNNIKDVLASNKNNTDIYIFAITKDDKKITIIYNTITNQFTNN